MAQIIEFGRKKQAMSQAERYKAIAKGRIERYSCDTCGTEFEVIDGKAPACCPGCGRSIEWHNVEENI